MNYNGYAIGPQKALKLLENVAEYLHFDHIFVKKKALLQGNYNQFLLELSQNNN
jgi:hypothetical protein